MKIGNIIYENNLVNHTELQYFNYYNSNKSYDEIDKNLITLYVGWNFMKKCNENVELFNNIDILNKKIINNILYWEFSFNENKSDHVNGIEMFTTFAPEYYFNGKYNYTCIDPIFNVLKTTEDVLNQLPTYFDKSYQYKDNFIYLINQNNIYGLNLKMFQFLSFNVDEILLFLNLRTNLIFNDLDGEEYLKYYKIFPKLELLKRYMVTFF
jgi:hypothetical protein